MSTANFSINSEAFAAQSQKKERKCFLGITFIDISEA